MVKTKRLLIAVLSVFFMFAMVSFVATREAKGADLITNYVLVSEKVEVRIAEEAEVDENGVKLSGLKFTGYLREDGVAGLSEDTFAGIEIKRASDGKTLDIRADKFLETSERNGYLTYTATLYNVPAEYYGETLTAKGFYSRAGVKAYSKNSVAPVTIAQTASAEVAAGGEISENRLAGLNSFITPVANNATVEINGTVLEAGESAMNVTLEDVLFISVSDALTPVTSFKSGDVFELIEGAVKVKEGVEEGEDVLDIVIGDIKYSVTLTVATDGDITIENFNNLDNVYIADGSNNASPTSKAEHRDEDGRKYGNFKVPGHYVWIPVAEDKAFSLDDIASINIVIKASQHNVIRIRLMDSNRAPITKLLLLGDKIGASNEWTTISVKPSDLTLNSDTTDITTKVAYIIINSQNVYSEINLDRVSVTPFIATKTVSDFSNIDNISTGTAQMVPVGGCKSELKSEGYLQYGEFFLIENSYVWIPVSETSSFTLNQIDSITVKLKTDKKDGVRIRLIADETKLTVAEGYVTKLLNLGSLIDVNGEWVTITINPSDFVMHSGESDKDVSVKYIIFNTMIQYTTLCLDEVSINYKK
jgi:hypothetical protein